MHQKRQNRGSKNPFFNTTMTTQLTVNKEVHKGKTEIVISFIIQFEETSK